MEWKLEDLSTPTAKRLYALGIQPMTGAFRVLYTAVCLLRENPDLLTGTTKSLYPQIAKLQNITTMSVDNHIRRAIKRIWNENHYVLLIPYLPDDSGQPYPSEFLSALLRWEADCIESDSSLI